MLLCYLSRFSHSRDVVSCSDSIVNASAFVNGDEFNFTCCRVVCLIFHDVSLLVVDAVLRR